LSHFKKYYSSGNQKFKYLGIFQSLKLHILMGKFPSISLKLNLTPSTSGCYGLKNENFGVALAFMRLVKYKKVSIYDLAGKKMISIKFG